MSPQVRRIIVTVVVLLIAGGIVSTMVFGPRGAAPTTTPATAPSAPAQVPPTPPPEDGAATAGDEQPPPSGAPPAEIDPAAPEPSTTFEGLHAVAPDPPAGGADLSTTLGSLDALQHRMQVVLTARGAGVTSIAFADIWETARARHQAEDHYAALRSGDSPVPPLPEERWRYVLQTAQPYRWETPTGSNRWLSSMVPLFAAHRVEINGESATLLTDWTQTGPGAFAIGIADGDGNPVIDITRRYVLDGYGITLEQEVVNRTGAPITVRLVMYGPIELKLDRSRYLDRRRFRLADWPFPVRHPELIETDDTDYLWEHGDVLKRSDKVAEAELEAQRDPTPENRRRAVELRREKLTLWPPQDPDPNATPALTWFASTNRYFGLAVHPLTATPGELGLTVGEIRVEAPGGADKDDRIAFTTLYSPERRADANGGIDLGIGIYAGPLERDVLGRTEPYASLKMQGLILYQMSSFCAVCTFQWLAKLLLYFLSAVDVVVGDWGVAIIILVLVVRTLLHPITKKSQINMQRFAKTMGELKPEIEKIQKKFPDEPRRVQAEQMKLMRERGVSPMQALGCLPMFLQMPIWVALYAMLYFAFELRQEPAFWGVFQLFGGWPFLADLSAGDHCFGEFDEPFRVLKYWNVTGINLLPLLMGLVFFFQQKYMSPPPSPSMSKEQLQQQKIMKVLMVVMFPVMLYSAPSGLTLYIFTSSLFGIIEGRYIRNHIKELELAPPKPRTKKKKKPRDPQARAFADAIERAKQKSKGPEKRYKKRR